MLEVLSANSSNFTFVVVPALLFTIAVLPALKWLSTLLKMYLTARDIPGPSGYLLFGNVFDMMDPASVFNFINECCLQFGKTFKLWAFHKLFIVMTDPAEVKFALTKLKENHRPGYLVAPIKEFFGDGLLSMKDDAVYKAHKRLINPLFYPGMMKNYQSVFDEKLSKLCDRLSEQADGRTIDIFPYFTSYTIETSSTAIIGCDPNNMEDAIKEYTEAIVDSLELIPIVAFQPWLKIPCFQMLFSAGRKFVATQKTLNAFIEGIVTARMQAERKTKETDREVADEKVMEDKFDKKREARSMLDLIVSATKSSSEKFSVEEMRAELQNFNVAGFQTVSTSLSFMCILLGIHEKIQEEVFAELEEVFGSSLRAATTEDLSRLQLLDRVIKETLRLVPGAQLIGREVTEDIHLPTGMVLPAGSSILVPVYHLQRDPKSFQDPKDFIPDRWRPENSSLVNPDAYIPFGTVGRTCVGSRYAMLQMRVVACNLLRRFKITTSYTMDDLKNQGISVVTVFYGGYKVQLHKRERLESADMGGIIRSGVLHAKFSESPETS